MDPQFLLWRSQSDQNQVGFRRACSRDRLPARVGPVAANPAVVPTDHVYAELVGQDFGCRFCGAGGATE
jgi:hypothetical protein